MARAVRAGRPQDFGIGRLFWDMREAAIVADAASGRVLLWNPAAEALFGYAAAEIVGRTLEALMPEQLRARHRAGLARYAATGHGAYVEARSALELPALRKGGEEI